MTTNALYEQTSFSICTAFMESRYSNLKKAPKEVALSCAKTGIGIGTFSTFMTQNKTQTQCKCECLYNFCENL